MALASSFYGFPNPRWTWLLRFCVGFAMRERGAGAEAANPAR
jgi:hypothetical protein